MRWIMMENRGDGGQCGREPCQTGVELMDGGAERVAGDVEGHGYQGHGGDDALDLEAEGLIGGDGDGHRVVVKRVGDRSSPGLTLHLSRAENPALAIRLVA
jgi:hypothetical protein